MLSMTRAKKRIQLHAIMAAGEITTVVGRNPQGGFESQRGVAVILPGLPEQRINGLSLSPRLRPYRRFRKPVCFQDTFRQLHIDVRTDLLSERPIQLSVFLHARLRPCLRQIAFQDEVREFLWIGTEGEAGKIVEALLGLPMIV
jgi:hypothetical protein